MQSELVTTLTSPVYAEVWRPDHRSMHDALTTL